MKIALFLCLMVVLALVLAQFFLADSLSAEAARQEEIIRAAPIPALRDPVEIPELMRAFALRGLAGQDGMPRAVRLAQDAQMLRGEVWSPLRARQHIAIAEPGFAWVAEQPGWLVPAVRVIDRFTNGHGALEVRVLGSIRVGKADGPDADVGEAMRYLSELPWVPDAILSNLSITWREADTNVMEAELSLPSRPVIVRFTFDDVGDVVEIVGLDRPDVSSDETILRTWRGVFSDYAEIAGRRIPRAAEVGYVDEGVYAPYFRCRITSYEMLR
jgi:hypothetical protein